MYKLKIQQFIYEKVFRRYIKNNQYFLVAKKEEKPQIIEDNKELAERIIELYSKTYEMQYL